MRKLLLPLVLILGASICVTGCTGHSPTNDKATQPHNGTSKIEKPKQDGQDKAGSPGNPPRILIASEIDKEGNLMLVSYQTVFAQPPNPKLPGAAFNTRILDKVPLKDVKIYDVTGKEVSVEAARQLLGKETPVLASSWGRTLPPFYRKVFKDEMLLFAFPKEAPSWKEIQEPEHPVQ